MPDLAELFTPGRIALDVEASSKRQLLRELAELVARDLGVDPETILEALLEREKLGSTAIGEGIAIPHARVESIDDLVGAFIRLVKGVDFDALDEEPVDLIFLLLAPAATSSAEHLRILAKLARALRDPELREALRHAETPERVLELLAAGRRHSRAA